MKNLKATSAIHLDNRRAKQGDKYPLKLRITFNRERRYYSIGRDATQEEWTKMYQNKAKGTLKDLQIELNDIISKAEKTITNINTTGEEFSFIRFEELYFGLNDYTSDVIIAFDWQIKIYTENGQISNATAYSCAKKSLAEFVKKGTLKFKEINPQFLEDYENWMLNKKNNSISTLGIYLRNLRALFNIAIGKGVISPDQYPFGKWKYIIPTSESADKSIPKDIIQKIYNYTPVAYSTEDKARDLWFLSYLCNGMNIKDICRLKYGNIDHEKITFKRAKTERTSKKVKSISILLNEEIIRIIKKWGNKIESLDTYVFPFFYEGLTPLDERRISQNLTGLINDWMKKISYKLEIPLNITTYSARHTHSNVLKESGAPIRLIADNLGHSSIHTTERHYLSAFDKETKKEYGDKLTFYLNHDNNE